MTPKPLFGGMEGGGTKFVCAVGRGPDEILEEIRYNTTTPEETLGKAVAFFKKFELVGIGLVPFGPLDLNPESETYGSIRLTPKPGWTGANPLKFFQKHFSIPLAIDLDVNAAAIGEQHWVPQNHGLDSLVYYTIGTGIGAGILVNGQIVHGLVHPEAGHVYIPHDWRVDPFPGGCPIHGDCFEGLANGPAMKLRWGQAAETLPETHPAWDLEAMYIALAMTNIILTLSPQRIVLGGGVMQQKTMFPLVRIKILEQLNGYTPAATICDHMEDYIVPPTLGNRSGVLGAIAMANQACQ